LDALLSFVGWLLLEVLLASIGRSAIFVFTFGRWRGERFGGDEGRTHGKAGSLSFVLDGQRVITQTGLLFAGLSALILLAVAVLAA
jgi:hypothetical protein